MPLLDRDAVPREAVVGGEAGGVRGFGVFAVLRLLHGVFAAVGERVEGVH